MQLYAAAVAESLTRRRLSGKGNERTQKTGSLFRRLPAGKRFFERKLERKLRP